MGLNKPFRDFGRTNKSINNVATESRNMPMVTGIADVSLIQIGTSAISTRVIAASAPTRKFPSPVFNYLFRFKNLPELQ